MMNESFSCFYQAVPCGWKLVETPDVVALQVPQIAACKEVQHGFTLRKYDVGKLPGERVTALPAENPTMQQRYAQLKQPMAAIGIEMDHAILANSTHGNKVFRAYGEDRGRGYTKPYHSYSPTFDGIVTDTPQVCLNTTHADCTGVIVYDPTHRAAGICHAGWRGTVAGVIREVIKAMRMEFSSAPQDLLAGITPMIGACCFEVDEPVIQAIDRAYPEEIQCYLPIAQKPGKYLADLEKMAVYDLYFSGLQAKNITRSGMCTCCHENLFYSYRREGHVYGVMNAVIEIGNL